MICSAKKLVMLDVNIILAARDYPLAPFSLYFPKLSYLQRIISDYPAFQQKEEPP